MLKKNKEKMELCLKKYFEKMFKLHNLNCFFIFSLLFRNYFSFLVFVVYFLLYREKRKMKIRTFKQIFIKKVVIFI